MGRLTPYPFGALVTRMFRELETRQRIFDLPAASFVLGDPAHDFAACFHGREVATPFGPAAGPHTQLAQNIVLSWLAGGRIIELKTVQADDRICVPRPCIDARTIGFNVEWSQELTLEQSLEEYVKASMLIQMLAASGRVELTPGFERFVFDISVGYDLASVTNERVLEFVRSLRSAAPLIDRLRREIPREWRQYADVPFNPSVAAGVTLSTFHGCPSREIERIVRFILERVGMPTVVKLNPTLLGFEATKHLLHDVLGYTDVRLNRAAFDVDLQWDDMCSLVSHARHIGESTGLPFGVKLTNTLVVENDGGFLPPSTPQKYMSGAPLHVLAMTLVGRFRRDFGARVPVSFSGGIDRLNFPDAVALGLVPVTVCTDFLKAGGYARGQGYFRELAHRMDAVGARTIDEFVARAYGIEHPNRDVVVANTTAYVGGLVESARYARVQHSRPPRKVGSSLRLLDCLTCDKCVPACPNDANFTFVLPQRPIPSEMVWRDDGVWRSRVDGSIPVTKPHQVGTFADLCNDCGNCDTICPEDGGPYLLKPRFFGSAAAWRRASPLDGFFLDATSAGHVMFARIHGDEFTATFERSGACFVGHGFALEFDEDNPAATIQGEADGEVDLTPFHLMNALRKAVLAAPGTNYVNCLP